MTLNVVSHWRNAYQNHKKYHYLKIIPSAVEHVEQLEFPDFIGGNTKWYTRETVWQFLTKLNIHYHMTQQSHA